MDKQRAACEQSMEGGVHAGVHNTPETAMGNETICGVGGHAGVHMNAQGMTWGEV